MAEGILLPLLAVASSAVKFAYADPPYPGQASKYAREARANGRRSREVDHADLVSRLVDDYPDGWALSTSSSALPWVVALVPVPCRVLAWLKPFVPAYKGIRPIYSWEPVILVGGHAKERETLVRDSLVLSPRMGLRPRQTTNPLGAKPPDFCRWLLDCLGYDPLTDTIADLFPGSGMMSTQADNWQMPMAALNEV